MNTQVREFFQVDGIKKSHFQAVRFLSEEKALDWTDAEKMGLSRGWFELSRVSIEDRIEFLKVFWLKNLSFHPKASLAIERFFERLDDIVVLVCRQTVEDPWRVEIVYSMADNSTFFRGLSPANEDDISTIKKNLGVDLPSDFWAFSKIHNGFGRLSELGLMPIEDLEGTRKRLISSMLRSEKPLRMGELKVDLDSLFPFYEEFGLASFQCFNAQWYPENEMGNVHFSGIDYTLSDTLERGEWPDNLAFPTFLDWLAAFLEGMNSCI